MIKKKTVKKKTVKKNVVKKKKRLVGKVTHFFSHIDVAVVKLSAELKKGEKVLIEGSTTSFEQKADSMQIEHKAVAVAKKGQSIGMKVKERVREGDKVYVVSE